MKSISSALFRSIVRRKLDSLKVERQCRGLKGRDLTFGSSCPQLLQYTVRGAKFYRTLVYRYSAGPSGFTDQLDFRTRVWLCQFLSSWRFSSESPPYLPAMGVHTGLVNSDASEERPSFTAVNLAFEMEQGARCDNKVKDGLMKDHFPEILLHSSLPSQQEESKFSSTPPTTPSTSDYAHSTSSRSYSPDNSEPALTRDESQSIDSLDSSSGVAISKTKSNPEKSIEDAHSSHSSTTDAKVFPAGSDNSYSLSSEAEVDSSVVACSPKTSVASADRSAVLSMFSLSQTKTRKKGIRQALATGWSNMKRIQTVPRDFRGLSRYVRLLLRMRNAKNQNLNVPTVFDRTCAKHPHKIAFYFEDEEWDFARVQEYSLRVAQVFRGKVAKGDAVALLMENRVEYIAIWLGLARLGAVPALLNSNLRLKSLAHCINTADCKLIICSLELQHAIEEIRSEVSTLPLYLFGASLDSTKTPLESSEDLDALLKKAPAEVPPEQASVNFTDKIVYIYTSGTTGLPKAAVITHSRYLFAAVGMLCMVDINSKDVLYDPLPLYHTAGGNIGVGMTFTDGVTVAIKKKFSVRSYFPDCQRYGCTVAQYIGEICRYLLNSPPSAADTQHKVRVVFGNGLRPQIWQQFQDRFAIPRVCEFYGATEGNANIVNIDGRVGAVGFLSVLLPSVYPCALIKVHPETGVPQRDEDGVCIRCKPGEPGEFVGKIIRNDPVREFKGYADSKATSKKIVHDVFKKGDSAFLSGDLLVMDEEGYLYFKDRTGDTFRWKGENVSTAEVENHLSALVKSNDICVYGVEIPHTEGKAGMAAVVDPDSSLDVAELARGITSLLPVYARPLLLRTVKHMEMTGTYKLRKTDLQKEAFDVSVIKDPIYLLDAKTVTYRRLDKELYEQLMSGSIKV